MPKQIDVLEIRTSLRWTRAKLAEEAGVNVSTVCRWENDGVPARGTARTFLEGVARKAEAKKARVVSAPMERAS